MTTTAIGTRYVYDFEDEAPGGRAQLGGKGIGLAEMTHIGLPVPGGFTVTTDACRAYMWTSLAITSIWLTVFATALFGPDIHSIDAGGSSTTIPSGVVIALFALFATMSVAKHAFDGKRDDA